MAWPFEPDWALRSLLCARQRVAVSWDAAWPSFRLGGGHSRCRTDPPSHPNLDAQGAILIVLVVYLDGIKRAVSNRR